MIDNIDNKSVNNNMGLSKLINTFNIQINDPMALAYPNIILNSVSKLVVDWIGRNEEYNKYSLDTFNMVLEENIPQLTVKLYHFDPQELFTLTKQDKEYSEKAKKEIVRLEKKLNTAIDKKDPNAVKILKRINFLKGEFAVD